LHEILYFRYQFISVYLFMSLHSFRLCPSVFMHAVVAVRRLCFECFLTALDKEHVVAKYLESTVFNCLL